MACILTSSSERLNLTYAICCDSIIEGALLRVLRYLTRATKKLSNRDNL